MKIAYLIMAHTDASQLGRLVSALSIGEITDFYIHIDRKSDRTVFENSVPKVESKVKFIDNQVYTTWGGYSQVRAYQSLINECVGACIDYDRVWLLSGLDYPLWSNEEMIHFFEENPELELMRGINISQDTMVDFKCRLYHFFRDFKANDRIRGKLIREALKVMKTLSIRKKPYIYTNGKKNDVYMSSEWWCLTGKCVRYLHEQLNNNKDWRNYFKYSYAPDELVVATIIYNSEFGKNTVMKMPENWNVGDPERFAAITYTHYVEYYSHIHIYDENDFDKLINSGKMFVRKLTSEKSIKLIEKIDEHRNSH